MKWLTWENVGIDRMGCAWLIRRWVDPQAEFVCVPVGQSPLPAGAEPFDIPGVRLSHRQGHSTFHAILLDYALGDPVLQRMARIVDAVDTIQEAALEPAAPGLDFICDGIRLSTKDDLTALERGGYVYDAVYAALAAEPQNP